VAVGLGDLEDRAAEAREVDEVARQDGVEDGLRNGPLPVTKLKKGTGFQSLSKLHTSDSWPCVWCSFFSFQIWVPRVTKPVNTPVLNSM